MKIAIVYSSNTGNTKIIAEAIKEELSNEDIVYFGKPENNIEADIYILFIILLFFYKLISNFTLFFVKIQKNCIFWNSRFWRTSRILSNIV